LKKKGAGIKREPSKVDDRETLKVQLRKKLAVLENREREGARVGVTFCPRK